VRDKSLEIHVYIYTWRLIMRAKFDRITVDPETMNGQPCIRNMRLTVRRVVEAVALYPD
jgi:hypothetical protein